MRININSSSLVPIYLQIKDQLRAAAATGELPAGTRVPSIRELAVELRVNPNTVARAYRELEFEGLLTTRRGDGTYIDDASKSLPVTQRLAALDTEADALARRAVQLAVPLPDVLELVEERIQSHQHATEKDSRQKEKR